MATEADYALLRDKTHTSLSEVDDIKAAEVFGRSETKYPSNAAAAFAAACVEILEELWSAATDQADYTQNEESERLSQIADAKKELLDYWLDKLAEAIAAVEIPKGQRPAFFGLAKATAKRWYP
jgi:truncated hemoglobin YjbI